MASPALNLSIRIASFGLLFVLFISFHAGGALPDREAIRAELTRIAEDHNIPSIGYAFVSHEDGVIADAVGMADVERGIAAGPDSLYRVGSITKSFVALGVLKRVHEGALDLDARLSELLPDLEFQNDWEHSHPVRLRHLMEHTSGFPDFKLKDFLLPPGTPLPELEAVVRMRTGQWRCRWQPGTRWAYSNIAYTLLAHILERNKGVPYHDYLTDLILRPAGMDDADFLGRNLERLVCSSSASGKPLQAVPINDHPAGYLHATPMDMGNWMLFLLDEPDWLPAGGLEAISRPGSIVGAGNGLMGYGLGFYGGESKGRVLLGHNGGIEGFLSKYLVAPELGVGYYYSLARANGVAFEAVNTYFRNLVMDNRSAVEPTPSVAVPEPGIEGWYRPASYRMEAMKLSADLTGAVRLRIVGDQVVMRVLTGVETRLNALGQGYYRPADTERPTHFIGSYEGKTVISTGFAYWERGSFVSVWALPVCFFSGLLVFLSLPVVVFGIHLVRTLRKRCEFSQVTLWPFLGSLTFVLIAGIMVLVANAANESVQILITLNPYSVSLLVLSLLFPLLWLWSVYCWWKSGPLIGMATRVMLGLALMGWFVVLAVFTGYGYIPEMTWRW